MLLNDMDATGNTLHAWFDKFLKSRNMKDMNFFCSNRREGLFCLKAGDWPC